MMHYRDWTAEQVRDWIEEAAATAAKLPGGYGPRKDGNCHPEIVREVFKDFVKEPTRARLVASSFALARMEAVWSWINALEHQEERELLYDWSEAKALGKGHLAPVIERSELSERTFSRAVNRVCQRIANALNRKHEIRLTMTVDPVSEMSDPVHDFSVASKYCAVPAKTPRHTPPTEKLWHDSSEASILSLGKHLAAVNRRRQNEAKRRERRQREKRKAA